MGTKDRVQGTASSSHMSLAACLTDGLRLKDEPDHNSKLNSTSTTHSLEEILIYFVIGNLALGSDLRNSVLLDHGGWIIVHAHCSRSVRLETHGCVFTPHRGPSHGPPYKLSLVFHPADERTSRFVISRYAPGWSMMLNRF